MISFTISATRCDSKQPVSSILTPQSWQEPIKNRWSDWCPRVRTRDWSSNEANNAANQANQAINPNRRGGRWLIPYQRRKSILMLKDSTLVGNYQQVLFPFKLRLLKNAFCSRVSFGFVLRLLMHTGCKSNHVQLSMLGSKYHQEHLWLVAGTVMAYLINSA